MKTYRFPTHLSKRLRLFALTLLIVFPSGFTSLDARPNRSSTEKSEPIARPSSNNPRNSNRQPPPSPPPARAPQPRANTTYQPPARTNSHQRSSVSSNRSQTPQPRPQITRPQSRVNTPRTQITPPSNPSVSFRRPTQPQPQTRVVTPPSTPSNRSSNNPPRRSTYQISQPGASNNKVIGPVQSNRNQQNSRNRNTAAPTINNPTRIQPPQNGGATNTRQGRGQNGYNPTQRGNNGTDNHRTINDPNNGQNRDHRSGSITTGRTRDVYHRDREGARTIYVGHRRDADEANARRRDLERRVTIEGNSRWENGRSDHHSSNRHSPSRHIDKHTHHHHDGCGHYYYGSRWNDFPRSHRHHSNCGHYLHNGLWLSFTIGHVHGLGCGHFFENGIWLSYTGYTHIHRPGCGHYYYDGFWSNTACYHIHGPGCGHYYYNNRWNTFPQTHIHTDFCGHWYDGTNWLIVTNDTHVHGPACGHYRFNGNWYAYPRDYYTMNRPDSLFFFVDLGDYRNRNLPDWAYDAFLGNAVPADIFRSNKTLAKAYAAFAMGKYYDSLVQFRLASRLEPDNALIYLARAQVHVAVKDYRSAYEDLVKGLEIMPEWADVRFNLTEIYSRTEDLYQHTEQLEQWVERYPRDFKAHFVLGYFYYFHQDYEAAKNELIYTLSWDENLPAAQLLMDKILEFEAESEVITRDPLVVSEDEIEVTTE